MQPPPSQRLPPTPALGPVGGGRVGGRRALGDRCFLACPWLWKDWQETLSLISEVALGEWQACFFSLHHGMKV